MNKQKDFDCVQMKADIQNQLQFEVAQLGEKEAEKLRRQRLLNDPILSSFLQSKTEFTQGTPAA